MAISLTHQTNATQNINCGTTFALSNHTVGTGSERFLLVLVGWENENLESITSVVWDATGSNEALTEIGTGFETSDDAVRAMACIVKMIGASHKYHRLVWMIDEFQRVRAEKHEVYKALNTGLHSVFNACPNNLSMFFSFSVKEKQEIFNIILIFNST